MSGTRHSRAEWQRIIEASAVSGLTQAAFCRREALALSAFQYWTSTGSAGSRPMVRIRDPAAVSRPRLGWAPWMTGPPAGR